MGEIDLSRLEHKVATVGRKVDDVDAAITGLHSAMQVLDEGQQATRDDVAALRAEFGAFLRRNDLAQRKQLAQTELIEVRQTLETEYGHYATVRRSAVGTLQAMDTGTVSPSAVRELSEELMITTPRYWLAPALVGLGAWLRDEQALGVRAVAEAHRRDPDKTTLFFVLVLQRQQRERAVAQWVQHYVARQDPRALAPEFRVVLDATTTGLFGSAAASLVAATVRTWTRDLGADKALAAKQVDRWVAMVGGLRAPVADVPALRELAPDWTRLQELAARVGAFGQALRILDAITAGPLEPGHDLRTRIDAVLDRLTNDFDHEEAPLRRRSADLEAIVEHDGDEEAARRSRAGTTATTDARTDFLTLVADAAITGNDIEAPLATQRLAVALSAPWATSAVDRVEAGLRRERPRSITLRHGDWQGVVDQATTPSSLRARVAEHHNRLIETAVGGVRVSNGAWAAGALGGLAGILAIATLTNGAVGFGIFMLLCTVGAGLWIGSEISALPGRRQQVREDGARRREAAGVAVETAAIAALRWQQEFDTALAVAQVLRGRLAALDVNDHLHTHRAGEALVG
ncbi:hypothetical protein [Actinomycetospora atypica]|uniref:Uncharacterized protein n=1 Tax=Actinomycetospora atypica TaxID=1290095 RepID=A0ABV9YFI4_9PSEU